MSGQHDALVDAVQYMRDVFMPEAQFRDLVENGAYGDEEFTMRGDDLAGFCWHFNKLLEHYEVK